jgi:hypothetical protein
MPADGMIAAEKRGFGTPEKAARANKLKHLTKYV